MEKLVSERFRNFNSRFIKTIVFVVSFATLAACGGGGGDGLNRDTRDDFVERPPAFRISVNVSGLTQSGLVLQNNAGDDLAIAHNGPYVFSESVSLKDNYLVTVKTQPQDELCTVKNGSGIAVSTLAPIEVVCSSEQKSFTIGGDVEGLKDGEKVTLHNNDGDPLILEANKTFIFATPVAFNSGYKVTVAKNPESQTCTVNDGSGSGVVTNITDIRVICSTKSYSIGGTISGLNLDGLVILLNNSDDDLLREVNGEFTFAKPIAHGSDYEVTIAGQPKGQTCNVLNPKGYYITENVTNIAVSCSTDTFKIGGFVTGLEAGDQVTLANNFDVLNDSKTVYANDPKFTFNTPVVYDGSYAVKVATQPVGKTCTVPNGTGRGVTEDVTHIAVMCNKKSYSIGGTITGLKSGELVILLNNSVDPLRIDATKSTFTFKDPIAHGSGYRVTVTKQPVGQICTVNKGSSELVTDNINDIEVACSTLSYTISGSVTGLNPGEQVTLANNGDIDNDAQTVKANEGFTFKTPVVHDRNYEVTVTTQPKGQICKVVNGVGKATSDVTNVSVECSTNMYEVGGVVIDSRAGGSFTLLNKSSNGNEWKTINGNGVFTFDTKLPFGSDYEVSIAGDSVGQRCEVINGKGTKIQRNMTDISVECVTNKYTIGGTISGLSPGYKITLHNNGSDALEIDGDQKFVFKASIQHGEWYDVTVTNAAGQLCTVANGFGTATAPVDNINVTCSKDKYSIGGTLSGLGATETIALLNHSDRLIVNGTNGTNAKFTFPIQLAHGSRYDVKIDESSVPFGKTCSVDKGSEVVNKTIEDIEVKCSSLGYIISGTLTGLKPGKQIQLKNNSNDGLLVTTNGRFQFEQKIAHGGGYAVTIENQPDTQACSLEKNSGSNVTGNVTSVTIDCYSVAVSTLHSFKVEWSPFITHHTVNPVGLMRGSDGNFYGTTSHGGFAINGSMFKMTPAGIMTTLHSFNNMGGGNDIGAFPEAGLIEADGKFYGTTSSGRAFTSSPGTIFSYSPGGQLDYDRFAGGTNPSADLVRDKDGNLYGISKGDKGTIFKMDKAGTFTTLVEFGPEATSSIGAHPQSRLILAQDGYLYATTQNGGTNNQGTIVKVKPNGADFKVVHRFSGADGSAPHAGLIQASDGHFYGTTKLGGRYNAGTIFKMTPTGQIITLHSFQPNEGAHPEKELMLANDGYFYGVTRGGGLHNKGAIFRITPEGKFLSLHSFAGKPAGGNPSVHLVEGLDGHLYGATQFGGQHDHGAFFRMELPLK